MGFGSGVTARAGSSVAADAAARAWRRFRFMGVPSGGAHGLGQGIAEVLRPAQQALHQFVAQPARGRVVGHPIEDIKLPEGVKIVTIVRGEQVIMAHHDTVIENGDHVILFLSDKRHVEQVERLFQA